MESLIKGLLSDDVEARIAARKQLMSLTSKEDIELFFKQIRGVEFGLDLYFDLAYLLSSIVVRGDIEQLPVAIKYLSFLTVHSNSKVVQRASVGLDYLFSSPELLLKYKYGVIKEVWPELQGMERGYLTNKIGEERMAILVNQLHENLSSDQSELVLQTVRALKMIKSYRSARHLSKVLHNSDLQVVREAIYGLGMIGGRGNYSAIRAKLELQDIPIVLAVVEVLPTLNPNRAVGDLKRVGMGDAAPAVKRRVMSKLADIGTLMAIIALLDLLAKYEDDPQITPNITWALQDISEKKKIDQIKRRFAASSVLVQIEMIRVLGMTDHPDCYNFLYDMIDPDEQSNVLISTLAALHRLLSHADKMPPVLLDLVEYSGPVGVAALELAIEYPDCDLNSLLLQIVHSSNGMEASILKGIFKLDDLDLSPELEQFVKEQLISKDPLCLKIALQVVLKLDSISLDSYFFGSLLKQEILRRPAVVRAFNRLLGRHPHYLIHCHDLMVDQQLLGGLDPEVVNHQSIGWLIQYTEPQDMMRYQQLTAGFLTRIVEILFEVLFQEEDQVVRSKILTLLAVESIELSKEQQEYLLKLYQQAEADAPERLQVTLILEKSGNSNSLSLLLSEMLLDDGSNYLDKSIKGIIGRVA